MNGLTLLALIALGLGAVLAYRAGFMRGRRERRVEMPFQSAPPAAAPMPQDAIAPVAALPVSAPGVAPHAVPPSADVPAVADLDAERARLIRSYEGEAAQLRGALRTSDAVRGQYAEFAEDRRTLLRALADARGETARYRQLVVDIEESAPPPLFDGPGTPDDLKLIVGVGPVLERMLHALGVGSYRQIAHWSEREIDEFDARLAEFPGRIRRDGWVTQARALHAAKYGETLPARDRG
jgi:predicted flap endonuclease-1-like 5' DNA nuclease